MKRLTVFTPAYNRKHTIDRTFASMLRQTSHDFDWLIIDDGSSDGTREWVESLGEKIVPSGVAFDWMGRPQGQEDENHFVLEVPYPDSAEKLRIEYVYKPNGGLYTGYNTAYAIVQTELCVCIDSDDYMPDDAVEKITQLWENRPEQDLCGIAGLDYNVVDKMPIGGRFPEEVKKAFMLDLHHGGDCKQVLRTDLMRKVAPQVGFKGERDFNPFYMMMQVFDQYPVMVANENFCWVEYQTTGDSMSAGIWKQYYRSPRSYAKYRIMQMQMKHGTSLGRRFQLCAHYISSCMLSKDGDWWKNTPEKLLTALALPVGVALYFVVKYKNRK